MELSPPSMTEKVKKALMPIPGATTKGRFCIQTHDESEHKTKHNGRRHHAVEGHAGTIG